MPYYFEHLPGEVNAFVALPHLAIQSEEEEARALSCPTTARTLFLPTRHGE